MCGCTYGWICRSDLLHIFVNGHSDELDLSELSKWSKWMSSSSNYHLGISIYYSQIIASIMTQTFLQLLLWGVFRVWGPVVINLCAFFPHPLTFSSIAEPSGMSIPAWLCGILREYVFQGQLHTWLELVPSSRSFLFNSLLKALWKARSFNTDETILMTGDKLVSEFCLVLYFPLSW